MVHAFTVLGISTLGDNGQAPNTGSALLAPRHLKGKMLRRWHHPNRLQ